MVCRVGLASKCWWGQRHGGTSGQQSSWQQEDSSARKIVSDGEAANCCNNLHQLLHLLHCFICLTHKCELFVCSTSLDMQYTACVCKCSGGATAVHVLLSTQSFLRQRRLQADTATWWCALQLSCLPVARRCVTCHMCGRELYCPWCWGGSNLPWQPPQLCISYQQQSQVWLCV